MSDDRPDRSGMPMDGWLALITAALGDGAPAVGPEERALLLDLARVAAHRSGRTAAPITTYIAGAVLGASDADARVVRLRDLIAELERD
jgi:hypothetical protein